MRVVPVVEQDRVAGGVAEAGTVADSGVPDVVDLDALRLESGFRGRHVRHRQSDRARRERRELLVVRLGRHHRQRDVPGLVLDPVLVVRRAGRQTEHLAVEARRGLDVPGRHADEVDALDLDHGAYLRCRMTALPSGSRKTAILQTPVSPEPTHLAPLPSSSAFAASTSGTRTAKPPTSSLNSNPSLSGSQNVSVTWPARSSWALFGSSGSPSTSWYHASARFVSRVGTLMKSTCSTCISPPVRSGGAASARCRPGR